MSFTLDLTWRSKQEIGTVGEEPKNTPWYLQCLPLRSPSSEVSTPVRHRLLARCTRDITGPKEGASQELVAEKSICHETSFY